MDDKKELISKVMNVEYVPNIKSKIDFSSVPSFPIRNLAGICSAVKPLVELIGKLSTHSGESGFYYVNTVGKEMFKGAEGFIGSLKSDTGGVGGGQAVLTPIALNPVTIATSCTIMAIEHKINQIEENQKNILDFMAFQEQSKIEGNVRTLYDILNNYKYNMDNEKYKTNKHILVQSIKNESEKTIALYESFIQKLMGTKEELHLNKKVDSYLKEITDYLNNYQLGIYQYAFSSFLEIMLLENFDEKYMDKTLDNIKEYKEKYGMLCLKVNKKMHNLFESSIQNTLILGASKVVSGMGKTIEKTPLGKASINKKLLSQGQKIVDKRKEGIESKMQVLSNINSNSFEIFEKLIEMVKMINNDQYNIAFDSENIYLDFIKS